MKKRVHFHWGGPAIQACYVRRGLIRFHTNSRCGEQGLSAGRVSCEIDQVDCGRCKQMVAHDVEQAIWRNGEQ